MKKRLYSCSAYIELYENKNGYNYELISYNTKICKVIIYVDCDGYEDIRVKLWRFPSATSQKHIRKFAKWLEQHIRYSKAGVIVNILQSRLIENRFNYGIYKDGFVVLNLSCEQLKERGFAYGYIDL